MAVHKKILIVDDEPDLLSIMQNFFSQRGYKVIIALRESEAYDLFILEQPDIVITDLLMPDGWGTTLIENIRKQNSTVPIIVMSVIYNMDEGIIDEAPDYYISKPFSMAFLLKHVRRILNEKHASIQAPSKN